MLPSLSFGQQSNNSILWHPWQYHGNFFSPSRLDCSNQSYKLVFYDEFDGTAIDATKWHTYSAEFCADGNCFGARGRDGDIAGLFLDENVEVNNGILKLHTKKEPNTWFGESFDYSAAMIYSKFPEYKFLYGKFEARIKMHNGSGLWPAFWLWGGPEIDIIEYIKPDKDFFATDLHNAGKQDSEKASVSNITDFTQNFHVYAVEWSPHKIEWFVDNNLVRTFYRYQRKERPNGLFIEDVDCDMVGDYDKSSGTFRGSRLMDEYPLAIILNTSVKVGQNNAGSIDDNLLPSFIEVDYIRVYQKTPQAGKVDLCGGIIDGIDDICYGSQEVYTFNGDYSNVTWTSSSNLNIISSNLNTVTVAPTNSSFATGWIKATVDFTHSPCSTKTFTKKLQTGELVVGTVNLGAPTYGSQPLQTVNFITGNSGNTFTTFNVTLDNSNTYTWQLMSGNGTIGGSSWNPQLITIPPNSSSISCGITMTTDCGLITRTVAFVKTSSWYRISPNPATNYISIEAIEDFEVEYSKENNEMAAMLIQPSFNKVSIYDFYTSELILETSSNEFTKQMTLDIGYLSSGQYILKITNEYNTTTHQIIVK
jgi:beta-glucanase (GH16 family)